MSDEKVYSAFETTRTLYRPAIRGRQQMVVSGHNLATQAALRILDRGGNAVDAGGAAGLSLADELHDTYGLWDSNKKIYLPCGKPPEFDELFYQKDLAQSMKRMAVAEMKDAAGGR